MIVETTLAIILLIALTIMLKRLRSFCDVNNILYEVMVRLNRSFFNRRVYRTDFTYNDCSRNRTNQD